MSEPALDPAFVQRVAGALLHFVWQGAAIAAITAICLRLMSRTSAEARYLVSISGLVSMLAAPILTFALYDRIGQITLKALAWASDGRTGSAVGVSPLFMYWIVGLWSAGVFGCIGRLILAWHFSSRLLRGATHEIPHAVSAIFERTAAILGIDVVRKRIRLLISAAVDSPCVVGWIRPAILVPVSALTGLTHEHLMAVLAHELAHIRRHDFLVNTLQTCVESLLFYHPAVWWVSGRVRAERENCCDDVAVRVCGDPRLYAQALVDLELTRPRVDSLAVSAAGGSLKERVQRLLGFGTSTADWRSVVVTVTFVCAWMVGGLWQPPSPSVVHPSAALRPQEQTQLAAVLPVLTPGGAATVVGTVAAIATAQPVVPEVQVPGKPGVVTGTLRTSTGLPMEEIRISIAPANQPFAFGALPGGLTDNSGRYRLEGIAPGRYHILVGMNGPRFFYPGVADISQATSIEVLSDSIVEVPETVVPGGTVGGRVVDMTAGKGRRIENLVLCCDYFKDLRYSRLGLRQGSPITPTISDDGSFVFPFVPPGNYALSILAQGNVIPVSWALAVGPNGVSGLQLDLVEGVDVQGTVLDQTGKPLSANVRLVSRPANSVFNTIGPPIYTGAGPILWENGTAQGPRVALRQIVVPKANPSLAEVQSLILERAGTVQRSAIPGPDGRFMFPNVYPGTYALEVTSGGITLPTREIQVGVGGLTNVSFQVQAIQVTGRVVAPSGGQLPKLNYIRLARSDSDADVFYGFPDKEGQFSLALLPGRYRVFTEGLGAPVRSVSDGSRDITEVTVETGSNPQIVVTLAP